MKHLKFLLIINLTIVLSCTQNSLNDQSTFDKLEEKTKFDSFENNSVVKKDFNNEDSVKSNKTNVNPILIDQNNIKPHPGKQIGKKRSDYDSIEWSIKMYYDSINRSNK